MERDSRAVEIVSPFVTSEIGALEAVIVHAPGPEIESVSPATAAAALYNDILPMSLVRKEHEKLKSFLDTVCTVHEFRDLVICAVTSESGRSDLLAFLASEGVSDRVLARLGELSAQELVEVAVEGMPARPRSLSEYLGGSLFALEPVPNLYFIRDIAMVFGSQVILAAMAHRVRRREPHLAEIAVRHCPAFAGSPIGHKAAGAAGSLEGGDVLILDENTLAIGVSERTSADGIDQLVGALMAGRSEPLDVYVVLLPKERASIHLDMVFTILDAGSVLVHEPVILGPDAVSSVRVRYVGNSAPEFRRYDTLLSALSDGGYRFDPVVCGGASRLRQQREQWLSGTNVFAFAPAKVLAYDCNSETLRALERAGFAVRSIDDFLSGVEKVEAYDRLVVAMGGSDLARGGGGPRCMTLPIRRAPLQERLPHPDSRSAAGKLVLKA